MKALTDSQRTHLESLIIKREQLKIQASTAQTEVESFVQYLRSEHNAPADAFDLVRPADGFTERPMISENGAHDHTHDADHAHELEHTHESHHFLHE